MSKFLHFIAFLALSISVIAQTPQLIVDYNASADDSFNKFNYKGATLGNSLILPVSNGEHGEEPAVVKDGEILLLKDINEGSESSAPRYFTKFNDLIYFSAFDPVNGGAVWATDGTEEGTVLKFAHHTVNNWEYPEHFIESRSGYLYYTIGNKLYRTDGEVFEHIFDNIRFKTEHEPIAPNYCLYEDEIAFVGKVSDYVKLYKVEEDSVVILDSIYIWANTPVYGLNKVESGLLFNVLFYGSDPDEEGTYIFRNETSKIEKITFNGKYASRINSFTESHSLILVSGNGYFLTNGIAGEEIKLFNSTNGGPIQTKSIPNGVYEDNLIFIGNVSSFPSYDHVIHYDGEAGESKNLLRTRGISSNIVSQDEHSFMILGVESFFDPELYYFNLVTGSHKVLYAFDNLSDFYLVGVADQKLYFLSNLNEEVGLELYTFDLDFLVSVDNFTNYSELDFKISMGSHQIISESNAPVEYSIHNISGQLIESGIRTPNTEYDHSYLSGIHIFTFRQGEKMVVKKVYIP